jgi:hypothetical protein
VAFVEMDLTNPTQMSRLVRINSQSHRTTTEKTVTEPPHPTRQTVGRRGARATGQLSLAKGGRLAQVAGHKSGEGETTRPTQKREKRKQPTMTPRVAKETDWKRTSISSTELVTDMDTDDEDESGVQRRRVPMRPAQDEQQLVRRDQSGWKTGPTWSSQTTVLPVTFVRPLSVGFAENSPEIVKI